MGRQLNDELDNISKRMNRIYNDLNSILVMVDDLKRDFDLTEPSIEAFDNWHEELSNRSHQLGHLSEEFDGFAFDGTIEEEEDFPFDVGGEG